MELNIQMTAYSCQIPVVYASSTLHCWSTIAFKKFQLNPNMDAHQLSKEINVFLIKLSSVKSCTRVIPVNSSNMNLLPPSTCTGMQDYAGPCSRVATCKKGWEEGRWTIVLGDVFRSDKRTHKSSDLYDKTGGLLLRSDSIVRARFLGNEKNHKGTADVH